MPITIDNGIDVFEFYNDPKGFFAKKALGQDRYDKIFKDKERIPKERFGKFFTDDYYEFDPWGQFIFRGQRDPRWLLQTSLERHDSCFGEQSKSSDIRSLERMMLREYQRHYKRLGGASIEKDAYHEWFASMQHHGAPTRLLDFSYSYYVALYFAIKNITAPIIPDTGLVSFSVFAVNYPFIEYQRNRFLDEEVIALFEGRRGDSQGKTTEIQKVTVEKVLNKGVLLVTPFHLNTRLTRQRGTFLMPTDITGSFMDNLSAIVTDEKGIVLSEKVLKITFSLSFKELLYVYRQLLNMNISVQTLFDDTLNTLGEVLQMKMKLAKYTDLLAESKQRV